MKDFLLFAPHRIGSLRFIFDTSTAYSENELAW